MKHDAQQFDLISYQPFNLAGEVMRQPEPTTTKPDPEQEGLFSDDAMGSEEAVLAHFNQPREEREFHGADACACPQFNPLRKLDGSYSRRCRDCGQLETEHAQPEGAHK